jgi:hypothetical protein
MQVCFVKEIFPTVADSRTNIYIHFVNVFENVKNKIKLKSSAVPAVLTYNIF